MAMDQAKGWKWASLALWALAALLALRLAFLLRSAPAPAVAPAAAPAAEGEAFRWPPLDAGLWNLFRSADSAAPKTAPGAWAARYRLAGVFLSYPDADPPDAGAGERCAILDDLAAKQQVLAFEKEWLKDAPAPVQVASISDDRVVLSDGEREETILLEMGSGSAPESGPAPAAAAARAKPALETNRFGSRIEENRWEIDRAAVLEYSQEVLNSPVRTAAMFLSMEPERGADGKVVGHRLNLDFKDLDDRDKDFYKLVGLQNGDVLHRVNSVRMTNQKRAEYMIGQFAQGKLGTVVIDVERGGKPQKLIYFVK